MTELNLLPHAHFAKPAGPVVLAVLDGVGWGPRDDGDAVHLATKPSLHDLWTSRPTRTLRAHGTAVGLPSDADMGNSEVGHNALGAGRIFEQGAALVNQSLASGALLRGETWRWLVEPLTGGAGTLHLCGLLSDGNVHAHIAHVEALIRGAAEAGVRRIRLHPLADGRDVDDPSFERYVTQIEAVLGEVSAAGCDARIASGGGRMAITMDRYEADWAMVERGWAIHVHGQGEQFVSVGEALRTLRQRTSGRSDQNLEGFVIADANGPIGQVQDGDAFVLWNFRGDRAIELTRAFQDDEFRYFDRGRRPQVRYAGMMQYDGDLHLPTRFLVEPPAIDRVLGEYLAAAGLRSFACSETQKFGHVTYFWNGNRSGKFDGETWQEVPSDVVPFEQRPWMKAAEIADAMIAALQSGQYRTLRCNFANGDMVGHTGNFEAATIAVEAVDLSLARVLQAVDAAGGVALITADHGNADEMFELDKKTKQPAQNPDGSFKAKTAHTLNPVPLILYDNVSSGKLGLKQTETAGLSNIAATVANLLGLEKHAAWDESVLDIR
jgi:2,3-bisphosphoglycerate-independent phosphoglycerate mutase